MNSKLFLEIRRDEMDIFAIVVGVILAIGYISMLEKLSFTDNC